MNPFEIHREALRIASERCVAGEVEARRRWDSRSNKRAQAPSRYEPGRVSLLAAIFARVPRPRMSV
jgi:hypothetical protein